MCLRHLVVFKRDVYRQYTGKVLFSKLGQPFGFPCDFSHFVCPLTSIKEDQEICAAYAGKHKGIDSLLQHAVIAIVPTPKHDP